MGLLSNLVYRASPENPTTSLANPASWLVDWAGGALGYAGRRVNDSTAMRQTAVYACIRVIAETIGSLPCLTYRRRDDDGRDRAADDPRWELLKARPNPRQTPMAMFENLVAYSLMRGNGVAWIQRDRRGFPAGLFPLAPDKVEIKPIADGSLEYKWTPNVGGSRTFSSEEVVHVAAMGTDSGIGSSIISQAREAIGFGLALEQYGAQWFGKGGKPSGLLTSPGNLSDQARENLKASWQQYHGGLSEAHEVAILEEGLTWTAVGLPPEDSQFLETRKFQTIEIARWFRVPPHKIMDLERATFSNIEQENLSFVVDTIRPWLVRIEQELNWKLYLPFERPLLFSEFLVDALLRGDMKTRFEAYASARQNGWLNGNEIRAAENRNSMGEVGEIFWAPLNMVNAEALLEPGGPFGMGAGGGEDDPDDDQGDEDDEGEGEDRALAGRAARFLLRGRRRAGAARREAQLRAVAMRQRLQTAHRELFRHTAARVVRREARELRREVRPILNRRASGQLETFLNDYYGEEGFGAVVAEYMAPALSALGAATAAEALEEVGGGSFEDLERFLEDYGDTLGFRYSQSSRGQILSLADSAAAGDLEEMFEELLGDWEERRPGRLADRETVQLGNGVTRAAWAAVGIGGATWVAVGRSCPLCKAMDGKSVGGGESFLGAGATLNPGGGTSPLTTRTPVGHPPLHGGCDCQLRPGR